MQKLFSILKIHRNEWPVCVAAILVIVVFQYLFISKFYVLFADYSYANWQIFMRNFHMSGFDPITYGVVTDWNIGYNLLRHPLLPFLLYPFYLINQVLWGLTGVNCVQFVVGVLLAFCTLYSFVFLGRILHSLIGIGKVETLLLLMFFFGFAYILIATFVPDHFAISLFMILGTLYVAGMKLQSHQEFSLTGMVLMLLFTAGVTLSNGVVTVLAILFVNGRKTFKKETLMTFFVVGLILVTIVLTVNAFLENPSDQNVSGWVDISLSRGKTLVENFFGETIQLHRKHMLGDVLVNRPVFVAYSWKAQYVVEAFIVVLSAWGVVVGRRSRFLWLVMSCFLYAVLLHLVLGFAINEVYIMAAHWAFVIPVAIGFLLVDAKQWLHVALCVLLLAITIYLWAYHGTLLYRYLTWPLRIKF